MSESAPPTPPPLDAEHDLSAFIHEWKEIDMSTLNLAVDTGRMQVRARALVWINRALLVGQFSALGWMGWRVAQGAPGAAPLSLWMLGALIVFIPVSRWVERSVRRVDEALARGSAAEVLDARARLLRMAVHDIDSRGARAVIAFAALAIGALFVIAPRGALPLYLPVGLAIALTATVIWSRVVRLPRLRRELEAVEALRRELAEDA